MEKVLKAVAADDSLTFRVEPKNISADSAARVVFDQLNCLAESPGRGKLSFTLNLMDIDTERGAIIDGIDEKFRAVATMPVSRFKEICSNIQAIGDTVRIDFSKVTAVPPSLFPCLTFPGVSDVSSILRQRGRRARVRCEVASRDATTVGRRR